MSDVLNLDCLVANGLISQDEANKMESFVVKVTKGKSDLLSAILYKLIQSGSGFSEVTSSIPFESETISTDEVTVESLNIPAGATYAIVTPLGNAALFRMDGEDPSPTEAHYLCQNSNSPIRNLSQFRFIAFDDSNPVNLFVSYYK